MRIGLVRGTVVPAIWLSMFLAQPVSASAPPAPTEIDAMRLEASYNAGPDLVKNAALDAHLADLIDRITARNPDAAAISLRAHALKNPLPYAFALDNGAVYVSTGLIARLANESQLAGLMALEVAAVVRHDDARSKQTLKERTLVRLIPNLLLIGATVGLAAGTIVQGEKTAKENLRLELQAGSDRVTLEWLARAGFDPREVPLALERLLAALTQEQRFGTSEFSSNSSLTTRIYTVQAELPLAPVEGAPPFATSPASWWRPIARYMALSLANEDLNTDNGTGLHGLLDEVDAADGPSGLTALMRAQDLRKRQPGADRLADVIAAYEACIVFKDVPASAFRELGFLYRRQGTSDRAKQNFQAYLARVPTAVDAPIIKSYIEAL